MSRTSRRFHKWERTTREHAWRDARQFALDLYWGHPRPKSAYGVGVALEPGEKLYHEVWLQYSTLARTADLLDTDGRLLRGTPYWRDWGWCQTLVTSHRLASRLGSDGGRLVSVWWTTTAGVQIDLSTETVLLDERDGDWRGLYAGPSAVVVAVAAVQQVHGSIGLIEHPGLHPLRASGAEPEVGSPPSMASTANSIF